MALSTTAHVPTGRASTPPEILLVDDDPSVVLAMARALSGVGRLRFANGGRMALRLAEETRPDVILLDADMPDMTGFEVCERLREDATLAEVPVIFITSHADLSIELGSFMAGACDFIAKPAHPQRLQARVQAHLRAKAAADDLRRLSTVDGLTGVGNRRGFDTALAHEWQRCLRHGEALSLLLLDVDHFKLFNDSYGHPTGDECLRAVAAALVGTCRRPGDQVYRYGGEEFAFLLPQTDASGAVQVGLRALQRVEALQMPHCSSPTAHHVTLSIGIASHDRDGPLWRDPSADSRYDGLSIEPPRAAQLLEACDRGLYQAKRQGRRRIGLMPFGVSQCEPVVRTFAFGSHEPQEVTFEPRAA